MAPVVEQGTIIVLDMGRNVDLSEDKGKKTFFEEAVECTARLIERKIMAQGKNLVGILLLGSAKTNNSIADQCPGSFRRIDMQYDLQSPIWQMIRTLPHKPNNKQADWLEALVVAADHFKNGVSGVKFTNKKVILMTNFKAETRLSAEEVEQIINGFKEDGIEVDVIGLDIYNEEQCEDFELARKIVEATNGATASFEDTMSYLLFHRRRNVKSVPWNVDLCIGPNIKIPVSAYIRLKADPIVKSWQKAVKDPVTLKGSATEAIERQKVHINTENQTVVERSLVIKGYNYGQQIIPFTECDKSMLYDSGEKSLILYGFTHKTNINWQCLSGDGLYYIFGRKGIKKAQHAIRCLIECLYEHNLVGIVRRVYNNGNAPKMFALFPVIDSNNYICLSLAALCYKEEIKNMTFPSTNLKRFECSSEQVNAFKDLIKAMDLTNAYNGNYDEKEAFPIAETVSPTAQYILDYIAFRAMNPGKPYQPREEIMMLFKQPPLIEKNSRENLSKIKQLFSLKKVETKTKKRKDVPFDIVPMKASDGQSRSDPAIDNNGLDSGVTKDMPKIHLPKKVDEIVRVGTADPVHDFKTLLANGKNVGDLNEDMTDVIQNLIYYNLDGKYSKALNAMTCFRAECVKSDPSFYNEWMQRFKQALSDRKKHDVIGLITDQKLGLILKEENDKSTFDIDCTQDSQVYENDTIPNSADLTIKSEVNDMFDEM